MDYVIKTDSFVWKTTATVFLLRLEVSFPNLHVVDTQILKKERGLCPVFSYIKARGLSF